MSQPVYRSREEFRQLALLHRYNAIAVGVLLLSGLLLYAEPLRPLIATVRVPLKYLHILSGLGLIGLAVMSAGSWGAFLIRKGLQAGRRLNMGLTVLWLAAWAITGLLMWLRGTVPYEIANTATTLHDWLTWLSIPWLIGHVAFRLSKVRRLDTRIELSGWLLAPTTRRGLLYAGAAVLGVVLFGRWIRSGSMAARFDEPPEPPVDPQTLPGGGMKGQFRYYFINNTVPTFDPDTWRLRVGERTYTWEQFTALPRRTMVCNFHCVTGWSVFDVTWEGVRLSDLLADAGFPHSPMVIFHSGDQEYTDSLTWAQAQEEDVMLAYRMEGRSLPRPMGGPVRLIVPSMYGYKSVKWVERVTPSENTRYLGYWEERGYSVDAYLERGESVRG